MDTTPDKHRNSALVSYHRRRAQKTPLELTQLRERQVQAQRRHRWGDPEAYVERLAKQNNLCALCGQPFGEGSDQPVQDHDHETQQLRDFLHQRCNLGIAHLGENPDICRRAAEYLERHKRVS